MIYLGIPYLQIIWLKKSFAIPGASTLVLVGMNVTSLLNLSTTVETASNPVAVVGKEVIKSIETLSNG